MINYKSANISVKRKVLFLATICFFAVLDAGYYKGYKISVLDFIILHFNEPRTIDYFYLLLIMVISGDIYNGTLNPYDDLMILKSGGRKKWFMKSVMYTFVLSFGSFLVYLVIVGIIGRSFGFLGWQLNLHFVELQNRNSIAIIGEILLLSGLRISFLNFLIISINLISKNNPTGFLGAFVISLGDTFFYEMFDVLYPLKIMPLEHTRIVYTEAVAPALDGAVRFSITYSLLYWSVGILLLLLFSYRIILHKDFYVKNMNY